MHPPPSCDTPLTGQVLGDRYRLLRPLGQGGMATVWEAEHVEIEKRVAVKVLAPEHARCKATVQRFMHEARAASRLRHDHIIDITDFGRGPLASGESVAYFAMEYLEGEDLAATLEHDGPLRWTRVLAIAKQICEALVAAHDRGVVHCDIKPANCYRVTRGDSADFIKVLDFGVASYASKETGKCVPAASEPEPDGETSGRRSAPVGTPGYMAGELLAGEPYDHRVDIYALGVLMYRLLTNKMPYAAARLYSSAGSGPNAMGDGEGSGATGLPGPAAPYPMRRAMPTIEIPAAFEALVLKAVARDPDQRFPTARALYEALVAVEQATIRVSPLPQDPLRWDEVTDHAAQPAAQAEDSASMSQTEVARAAASNSMLVRTDPDLASGYANPAWLARPRPSWPRMAVLMALAAIATTAAVRVAWALSG